MLFLNYINAFRALAIIMIVALHTIHIFTWEYDVYKRILLYTTFGNGSIFFIFISGYLFQHLSAKFNTQKYYKNKLNNVLIPYLIITAPAMLYFITGDNQVNLIPNFYDLPIWKRVFYGYGLGLHLYTMWFIPMITFFFAAAPILLYLARPTAKIKYIYWSIPLLFVLACNVERGSLVNNIIHFAPIYILGMFCSQYKQTVNRLLVETPVLLTTLAIFILLFYVEYNLLLPELIYINFLQKMILTILILGLLIKYNHVLNRPFISVLANTSFGVFLIHAYVLFILRIVSIRLNTYLKLGHFESLPGNLLIYALTVLMVMIISILLVLIIKHIIGDKYYFLVGNIKALEIKTVKI